MMRRSAPFLLVCGFSLSLMGGCGDPAAKPPGDLQTADANDPYADPTYQAGGSSTADPGYAPMPAESTGSGRVHTVAKSETLYSLARTYYNDQKRWRDIYEANRSTIRDPNRILVGQRLVIP